MSRKRKRQLEAGIEMDMTPMIDIVFLLIAFFMIVSDLSNLNIQPVILPIAPEAKVARPQPGEQTIILNLVLKNEETGEAGIRFMSDARDLTLKQLIAELRRETELYGEFEPNPDSTSPDSLLKILVRCDERNAAGVVHTIFKACQQAKIYKVAVAAVSEQAGKRYTGE